MCSSHRCILPLIITVLLVIPVGSQSCAMNTLSDYSVTNLQSDYYMRQARSYQREAEYYTRQAQSYDREADYYNRQAQNYLREAEYYSKRENYDQVRSYQRRAKDATDKARLTESYRYLISYYFVIQDNKDTAKQYAQKLLEIDPDNEIAKQVMEAK